jgi:hypothetical protein
MHCLNSNYLEAQDLGGMCSQAMLRERGSDGLTLS